MTRPSKKLERTVCFTATEELVRRLDARADQDDRTRSYVARKAVEEALGVDAGDLPEPDVS